jgi:hypothetical protein
MTARKIELKGLSHEQVDRLLPEGLISLCWRGSVAHGMYVPKSDPDSIDDKEKVKSEAECFSNSRRKLMSAQHSRPNPTAPAPSGCAWR